MMFIADLPDCPECKAGKHANCDGNAWDNFKDDFVPCGCWEANHRGV